MLRVSLYCIGLIAAYFMILPAVMTVAGYYPDGVGWKTAQQIVAKGGRAADCKKIIHLISHPLSPSQGEQRADCIYEYANLTKDPSACELLMPSSYGLSCVGAATLVDDVCHFYNGDEYVYWDEVGDAFGKTTIQSCQYNDPAGSRMRNQCCVIARVRYLIHENDCSSLKGSQPLYDECQNDLAAKNRNPEACSNIANENLRKACIVRAKAMKENPYICDGCRKPVNDLSELQ